MKTLKRKILVLGASSALGKDICIALKDVFGEYLELYIGDNEEERGLKTTASVPYATYRPIDTSRTDLAFQSVMEAIEEIDCVIMTSSQSEPVIQKACFLKQVTCIDVNSFQDLAAKTYQLEVEKKSLSIMMAGFFPGLSGVYAHDLIEEFEQVDEIQVGLLLNANSTLTSSEMTDLLQILNTPLDSGQKGFSKRQEMRFFHSDFPVREINPDERKLLQKKTNMSNIYYWLGWNKPKITRFISFLAKRQWLNQCSKLLQLFFSNKKETEEERVYTSIKLQGIKNGEKHSILIDISAKSLNKAAAFYIAMIADKSFISDKTGVRYPFEVMALNDFNYFDYDPYMTIKRYDKELE